MKATMLKPESPSAFIEEASISFKESWNREHHPFPNVLFHYTSATGLIGILKSKSIWLTDLRYMNDGSELEYAEKLIGDCIAAKQAAPDLTDIQASFLSRIAIVINPFKGRSSIYSASFCENGNLLSQWRSYRGHSGGYAMGFDFFHTLRTMNRPCALRRITYDVNRQRSLVNDLVDKFLNSVGKATSGHKLQDVSRPFWEYVTHRYSELAVEFLFCFKHPDFHEEKEWRLVNPSLHQSAIERHVDPLNFREYQGNIVPYHIVSFEEAVKAASNDLSGIAFPVREIVIGPTINSDLNEQSLAALMLSTCKDMEPTIKKSEIPLRWL